MTPSLQDLKNQRLIWNASRSERQQPKSIASSYPEFDQRLDGWPESGLVELQIPTVGIGEVRLILPALQQLAQQEATHTKLQVWLTEQMQLMPQALDAAFAMNTVVIEHLDYKQILWALETLLSSGVCSAVVCWLPYLKPAQAKRLQVLAKDSNTLVFCLRDLGANLGQGASANSGMYDSALAISLRIRLSATDSGLNVDVLKRQNALPISPFELRLSERTPQLYVHASQPDIHAYQHNVVPFPTK